MLFPRENPGPNSTKDLSTIDSTAGLQQAREAEPLRLVFCPFIQRPETGTSRWQQRLRVTLTTRLLYRQIFIHIQFYELLFSCPNECPLQQYLSARAIPHHRGGAVPAAQRAKLRDHEETSTTVPKTKFDVMLTYMVQT